MPAMPGQKILRLRAIVVPAAMVLVIATPASAQSAANQSGSGKAEVVAPLSIQPVLDLRFGRFYRPVSNGNLTVSPSGAVTGTGSMASEVSTPQATGGRGPGTFLIRGDPSRVFRISLPNRINITNGAATMRVSNFTSNVPSRGVALSSAGQFNITVGARLQVAGNQAVGAYSGRFPVTVTYD